METGYIATLLVAGCITLGGCAGKSEEEKAKDCLDTFATAYFNWDFPQACQAASPRARQWLQLMASQVGSKDIEAIKAKSDAAEIEFAKMEVYANGDSVSSEIMVKNFLAFDSIGKKPQICDEGTYIVRGCKIHDKWQYDKPEPKR